MNKRWVKSAGVLLFTLACVMLTAILPVKAATANSEAEIRQIMEQAFANGDLEVKLTVYRTFSVDEYQAKQEADNYASELIKFLEETALKNGKLMNGTSYIVEITDSRMATYRFDISSQFTKKVTVLSSEKSAYTRALKALKKRDYSTNFYAENAMYYDTFVLALQHHPEYNYGIMIWKSADGTFGYRPSGDLSTSAIKSKMTKADTKADAVLKKIIKKGMTNKQKLKAIHDYLVKNCVYKERVSAGSYHDAFTAYGCLINKEAVCQGYAAAFNLLALKAGIRSIAVTGDAGGSSHAWNYVKNGSSYYYIDATWDDPVPDGGSKAKVMQDYSYLTQKQLEKKHTHTWDKTENAKKYVDMA